MAVLISAPHHSTQNFTYNKDTSTFLIEESDFGRQRYFGQIYSDAADEGFWLTSHKTGVEKPFALHLTHTRDGEITHWEYREINPRSGRQVDTGLSVIVFND